DDRPPDPPPAGRRRRRGRRRRLDRRHRQVQVEAAELRDPVPDRLHQGRLSQVRSAFFLLRTFPVNAVSETVAETVSETALILAQSGRLRPSALAERGAGEDGIEVAV